jgi:hypothetical protein
MAKIIFILAGMLGLLFLVNSCSAVDFSASPGIKIAHPGETVNYDLSVSLNAYDPDPDPNNNPECTDTYPMIEIFSINNPRDNWVYSFSRGSVILDNASRTNTSTLFITVPTNATQGMYEQHVKATSFTPSSQDAGTYEDFSIRVVNTDVQVPEFPTVAVPVAALLGLIVIFGRRKT